MDTTQQLTVIIFTNKSEPMSLDVQVYFKKKTDAQKAANASMFLLLLNSIQPC